MTTLTCRHIALGCLDTLSANDSTAIQKVFLHHVHTKHAQQWGLLSKQFKAISIVTERDRFRTQEAADSRSAAAPGEAAPS